MPFLSHLVVYKTPAEAEEAVEAEPTPAAEQPAPTTPPSTIASISAPMFFDFEHIINFNY